MKDVGVYVHVPFCKAKCYYCDFVSFAGKEDLINEYITAVIKEIDRAELDRYNVKTVYIGGGTPSIADVRLIKNVLDKINPKDKAELTIEVNPGTVSKEKLENYISFGINRLSIGLQSAKNTLLKQIRKDTYF